MLVKDQIVLILLNVARADQGVEPLPNDAQFAMPTPSPEVQEFLYNLPFWEFRLVALTAYGEALPSNLAERVPVGFCEFYDEVLDAVVA